MTERRKQILGILATVDRPLATEEIAQRLPGGRHYGPGYDQTHGTLVGLLKLGAVEREKRRLRDYPRLAPCWHYSITDHGRAAINEDVS